MADSSRDTDRIQIPRGDFRVAFQGVRGSYAVPGPSTLRYGGNTPCVEVRAGGHLVILDAGTGIVSLGESIAGAGPETPHMEDPDVPIRCTILISHAHHDHTQGFPFFRPIYQRPNQIHVYGPRYAIPFEEAMREMLSPPHFPVSLADMPSRPRFGDLDTGDRLHYPTADGEPKLLETVAPDPGDDTLWIKAFRNPRHPDGGVLNYRIHFRGRSLVYATDTEGIPGGDPTLARFARGADLLIHDAMYTDEEYADPQHSVRGYGHSTYTMAIAVARLARVKRLVLFHHDPARSDDDLDAIEMAAQALMPGTFAAREDYEIEL